MPTAQTPTNTRRLAFPSRNPPFMFLLCSLAVCLCAVLMTRPVDSFQPYMFPRTAGRRFIAMRMSDSSSSSSSQEPTPTTFREAEVLGLKLMQQGDYELALKAFQTGLKLPGSRSDVVRTKSLSGPSPVGGALGGFESNAIQSLDEFELQACQYNLACAYAQLNQLAESINSLEKAFQAGFDNYATVRGDPDLDPIKKEKDFEKLMERYEPKKGFNPFGLFGGKS